MERITLTRREAAAFIGIDEDTLTQWCRAGRIAYSRKNPSKKSSPYLFTRRACIAAIDNPINTVAVNAADQDTENITCRSSVAATSGTRHTPRQTAAELSSLLKLRTKGRPKSYTTG